MEAGKSQMEEQVVSALSDKRPNIHEKQIRDAAKRAQEKRQARAAKPVAAPLATPVKPNLALAATYPSPRVPRSIPATATAGIATKDTLEAWVYNIYIQHGFDHAGAFKGYKFVESYLKRTERRQPQQSEILLAFNGLRAGLHPPTDEILLRQKAKQRATEKRAQVIVQIRAQTYSSSFQNASPGRLSFSGSFSSARFLYLDLKN
ncbi:hypothetical protein EJ02DRAFT_113871 [Clathrospora elynae]|uniref:Uncharacterized protein n=1 Tax=Clathrospora elynae TaxID=706981 RepID=A0A6A5SW43_9PLEO|nr:hypothetical protein EJ02DRAFT_113871 [Clathrospora elynae]